MGCAPARGKISAAWDSSIPRSRYLHGVWNVRGFLFRGCDYYYRWKIERGRRKVHWLWPMHCPNCPQEAMQMDWRTEIPGFMERLLEYAYGAMFNKRNKIAFINFVNNVTADCDLHGDSDTPIVPDVGILASFDPIALDHACLDLVNQQVGNQFSPLKTNFGPGEDKFKGINPFTQAELKFPYGEEIGLGQSQYELIEIQMEQPESHWH